VSRWFLAAVQVSGGFLAGVELTLPPGLTCIIGPRGSGKSTLAEAIRFGIAGATGANKARLDLIQANLAAAVITLRTAAAAGGYTIRRVHREPASLVTEDGKSVPSIDLDRGTFLPLDAYGTSEIEAIADESLGARRRGLLDDLRGNELHHINLSLAEKRRALDANADAIRSTEKLIADLTEQAETLGGARARLAALPVTAKSESSEALVAAAKQRQINEAEVEAMTAAASGLADLRVRLRKLADEAQSLRTVSVGESLNEALLAEAQRALSAAAATAAADARNASVHIERAEHDVAGIHSRLADSHRAQDAEYSALQAKYQAAGDAVRQRHEAERAVARLEAIERQHEAARAELTRLREQRKALKGDYLLERERVSNLREEVASRLQADAGGKVRVRVLRNADSLAYRSTLLEGLKGARVKNHDEIIECLMRLRPEQLAQLITEKDTAELEHLSSLGGERCRRILDGFRSNIDPLALEVVATDDQISIELNVSTAGAPNYRDAAELSRGQKCTALLPLLLARRDTPLLIDQPEDNLDNHFIFETVVDSIRQRKTRRQMIFITHNANIPVLAEADLVVVMNSDGKAGFVETAGGLDECREQIIDLLEGGREAFERRRKRYEGAR
jgi:ABC-type cobalamin/Fe3+-siderophores transport system ATPase subunit